MSETKPVAWMDDGTTRTGSETTGFRVVTDETKASMPNASARNFNAPLYPSSAITSLMEENERLADEVERLRGYVDPSVMELTSIKALTARIAELERQPHYIYIGKDGKAVKARVLEDRAEAAEARVAELEAMLQQTVEETSDEIAALMIRAQAAEQRVKDAVKVLDNAGGALSAMSDAVFNDNGDMTVRIPSVTAEECISAYFAERSIQRFIKEAGE